MFPVPAIPPQGFGGEAKTTPLGRHDERKFRMDRAADGNGRGSTGRET